VSKFMTWLRRADCRRGYCCDHCGREVFSYPLQRLCEYCERELEENGEVVVRFLLEGRGQTYRSSVRITPDCRSENGLYTSSVICENLDTGTYTLCVESASGARFDYILAEDGSRSKYEIQDQQICFELSENAKEGSAWFMLREGEVL